MCLKGEENLSVNISLLEIFEWNIAKEQKKHSIYCVLTPIVQQWTRVNPDWAGLDSLEPMGIFFEASRPERLEKYLSQAPFLYPHIIKYPNSLSHLYWRVLSKHFTVKTKNWNSCKTTDGTWSSFSDSWSLLSSYWYQVTYHNGESYQPQSIEEFPWHELSPRMTDYPHFNQHLGLCTCVLGSLGLH